MWFPTEGSDFMCFVGNCDIKAICRINVNFDGRGIQVSSQIEEPIYRKYCLKHYDEFWIKHAREWCEKRGLITHDQQVKFIRENIKNIGKKSAAVQTSIQANEDRRAGLASASAAPPIDLESAGCNWSDDDWIGTQI